jgi:hypothetical protein
MSRPVGRPTKYAPEIGQRLAEYMRYGATIEDAARSEGLGRATVDRWIRRYPELRDAIERAQGDFVTQNLRHMNVAAMRGSWQASAWLLEHIAPERYGKAATELPTVISLLLEKLPPETAGQVAAAWGIVGALAQTSTQGSDDKVTVTDDDLSS